MSATGPPARSGTGAVVVDPRMRSRRMEVLRDAARRRARRGLVVVGLLAALVLACAVTQSPLLDVDHIRVTGGGEHVDPAAVVAASGVRHGRPLTSVDPARVARRVERLPWVADARVRREFPGTLRIEVDERSPAAVVEISETMYALVDGAGRVLTIDAAPQPGMAVVTGVAAPVAEGDPLPADARDALAVAAALAEHLPGQVTAISTDLEATLSGGGRVLFGSADDLDDKIVALRTVLSRVDMAGLCVLDVRVPGSPALTRNEGCP